MARSTRKRVSASVGSSSLLSSCRRANGEVRGERALAGVSGRTAFVAGDAGVGAAGLDWGVGVVQSWAVRSASLVSVELCR